MIAMTGEPRVDYARTYNVIPTEASDLRAMSIFLDGWKRARETAGGSYDDAGIGDLTRRAAVLWDIPRGERDAYVQFFETHYPGVMLTFVTRLLPEPAYKPMVLDPPRPGMYRLLVRVTMEGSGTSVVTTWGRWLGESWLAHVDGELLGWAYPGEVAVVLALQGLESRGEQSAIAAQLQAACEEAPEGA
jgi:hypothetical protein